MEADTCVICNRETPDLLLWPPDEKTRVVVCEECFIELFVLSEELSSKPGTISSAEVAVDSEGTVEAQNSEDPVLEPDVKNRRFTARWAIKRTAKMSWLVGGAPVSVKVQLVDGSEHGLGIRSPESVEVGRAVRITLADATALRGNVRHCRSIERGYHLGVLLRNVRLLPSE